MTSPRAARAGAAKVGAALAAAAVSAAAVAAGCGGAAPAPTAAPTGVVVPARAPTAGDALLAWLPGEPDVLVELDLARLRDNPVVGALAQALLGGAVEPALPAALGGAARRVGVDAAGLPRGPLARARAVVLASYRVGAADAVTVTLVAAPAGLEVPGAVALADGVLALGPGDALRQAARPPGAAWQALRARAMPAGADGAVLRVTARLGFDARVALAGQLGLDEVPATVSAWLDVADDLAAVAVVEAPEAGDAPGAASPLAALVRAGLAGVAAAPTVRALGLAPAVRGAELASSATSLGAAPGERVRAVVLVGPRRLRRAVARAEALAAAPAAPAATPPMPPSVPPEEPR